MENSINTVEKLFLSESWLSDRKIKCICGKKYDKDENAAKNVYCLGQAILKLGLALKCVESFAIQEALTLK